MTSETKIAKLALHHLGDRYDLDSLKDLTPEAEALNLIFDDTRDAVLRAHPWKFAKTYVSPTALSGTPPAGWGYMFTYPDEALKVVRIVNPLGRNARPIKFDVARNSLGNKVILCDLESPEFQYTARIEDPYEFDALFVDAYAYLLAKKVAVELTGDRGLMADMAALYETAIGLAQSDDANEGVEEELDRDPDWILARA